jgi:hypothetical protein
MARVASERYLAGGSSSADDDTYAMGASLDFWARTNLIW